MGKTKRQALKEKEREILQSLFDRAIEALRPPPRDTETDHARALRDGQLQCRTANRVPTARSGFAHWRLKRALRGNSIRRVARTTSIQSGRRT
jgi:hypothetical protein